MNPNQEIVSVPVVIKHVAERAILVNFGVPEEAWVPISQIWNNVILRPDDVVDLRVPRWLAREKGMI